jgi:carboxylesterase
VFWLVVLIAVILILGHYGLPEKVNPHDFQEPPPAIKIMRGAEPFRMQGNTDVGFLLVHGFEDSPYTMRNIGDLLHREGHTVIAPLLPGHGTNLRDFAKTRYEHWLAALEKLVARKQFVSEQELERRVDAWDAAARTTPHGEPVELMRRH